MSVYNIPADQQLNQTHRIETVNQHHQPQQQLLQSHNLTTGTAVHVVSSVHSSNHTLPLVYPPTICKGTSAVHPHTTPNATAVHTVYAPSPYHRVDPPASQQYFTIPLGYTCNGACTNYMFQCDFVFTIFSERFQTQHTPDSGHIQTIIYRLRPQRQTQLSSILQMQMPTTILTRPRTVRFIIPCIS